MRLARTDAALDALHEERDHLAIQISLLADAESQDPGRLTALRQQLKALELRIGQYRPADA